MEDYLKHIEIFHRDLMSSQSNKEKYIKCKDCDDIKKFIINENELIYSCGSTHSGPCGDQFKINIPDYIHYEKIMKTFHETMNGSFKYESNITDLSEYDIDKLSKYMKLDDELKEYNELKETIKRDSQQIKGLFSASNRFKQYYDSLNELNNTIKKNNLRKKKILFDLLNEQLTLEDKLILRKEYAKIVHNEKNETYPIYESLLNHRNNHYLLLNQKEKYVEKYQSKYLEIQNTRTKKKSKKDETNLKKKQEDELEDLEVEMAKDISKKQSDKKSIKYFSRSKDNKWLSAFNQAEPFEYDGYTYPTVEHAFHSQKIDPSDSKVTEYKEYLSQPDLPPNEAKKYGGKTSFKKNNFTFRDDWDKIKLKLMEEITEAYYSVNPKMKQKLIDTKDSELLHTGPRIDPFWGTTKNGGENHHGKILMKLREKYS